VELLLECIAYMIMIHAYIIEVIRSICWISYALLRKCASETVNVSRID
jgi:hypothetical protein